MALGSTHPSTEMSTRNISWGKGDHLHVPIVFKSGSLILLELAGPVKACNGIALPLPYPSQCVILVLSPAPCTGTPCIYDSSRNVTTRSDH
jgi:hypothetical protein